MTGPVDFARPVPRRRAPLPIPAATLPPPERTDWRKVIVVNLASVCMHGLVLGACAFLVFEVQRHEDIFSTLTISDDPVNEPIFLDTTIQLDDFQGDKSDRLIMADDSAPMNDTVASVELDFDDLEPSFIAKDYGVTVTNIKPGDHFAGRTSAAKGALVRRFGGNSASEAAVAAGLKWLASRQLADGSWSFDHTRCKACADGGCSQPGTMGESYNGATAFALLAFLGGGHTHQKGNYQTEVKQGLETLLKYGQTTPNGLDLSGKVRANEKLYVHGIATIALCETAALTKDKRYSQAATEALRFIAYAQDPKGGGWRYDVQQRGDTSVVGWQIMALKSGQSGKLKVPGKTFKLADKFLDNVQGEKGAVYGYMNSPRSFADAPPTMTAVGLLCRMYMGWDKKNPHLMRGVAFLDQNKPSANDMYYNYYATQVMHHYGGEEWSRWNSVMRDHLVRTQEKDGVETGSWNVTDPHGAAGGRLYQTCLCVMTLEVYYRHLPIYNREKLKVEF